MVTVVTFTAMRLVPGGPFSTEGRPMSPQIRANFEARYHLDEPTWKQYIRYMVGDFVDTGNIRDFGKHGLLRFDLGLPSVLKGPPGTNLMAVKVTTVTINKTGTIHRNLLMI